MITDCALINRTRATHSLEPGGTRINIFMAAHGTKRELYHVFAPANSLYFFFTGSSKAQKKKPSSAASGNGGW